LDKPEAQRDFVRELLSLLDPSVAHPEDGSSEFFVREPSELFKELNAAVVAPLAPGRGGGADLADDAGGAAGLKDLLEGTQAVARRIANFTTYFQMKQRAGVVGWTGVAQLLRALRAAKPNLRLHLIGHSFGGRVVTAAADALAANTPNVTITLLQAAYSHNGLGEKFDKKHDGFFRKLVTEKRASGPIVITYTKNDRAVGIAYPLASRISREKAAMLGDKDDPYGGMGRNGAQFTPEANSIEMLPVKDPPIAYAFARGSIYNLNADRIINDHSDIKKHPVVYAALSNAGSID